MVGFSQRGDDAIAASVGGAKVDEQNLIVSVVDDVLKLRLTLEQVNIGQLALEDAELDVVAPVFHRFEDLAKSLSVSDVVADNVGSEHVVSSRGSAGKTDLRTLSLIWPTADCTQNVRPVRKTRQPCAWQSGIGLPELSGYGGKPRMWQTARNDAKSDICSVVKDDVALRASLRCAQSVAVFNCQRSKTGFVASQLNEFIRNLSHRFDPVRL